MPSAKLAAAQAEMKTRMKPEAKPAPASQPLDIFGAKERYSVKELAEITGGSPASIRRRADSYYADNKSGVLYLGESGNKRSILASAARRMFGPKTKPSED